MYLNFQLFESEIKLEGYEWKTNNVKAVVCLVHGIGEHAGRYDRVGELFNESGIAMVGMDLRGHGLSMGKRGHTAPRWDILQDIDRLLEYSIEEYPEVPVFLYGHSMGGNIVLDYRRRGNHRAMPQGYLVTSPWIILQRKIPKYLYVMTELFSKIKPDFQMNSDIKTETLGNREVINKLGNQHLIHGKISVQTALDGIQTAEALMNNSLKINGPQPLKPLLLMHGDADKICAPEGSRKIAQIEKDLCRYIEWEGLYHEIHNGGQTADGTEVIQTMIDWISYFEQRKSQ